MESSLRGIPSFQTLLSPFPIIVFLIISPLLSISWLCFTLPILNPWIESASSVMQVPLQVVSRHLKIDILKWVLKSTKKNPNYLTNLQYVTFTFLATFFFSNNDIFKHVVLKNCSSPTVNFNKIIHFNFIKLIKKTEENGTTIYMHYLLNYGK